MNRLLCCVVPLFWAVSAPAAEPGLSVQIYRSAPAGWTLGWMGREGVTSFPQMSPGRDLLGFSFLPIAAYLTGTGLKCFAVEGDPLVEPRNFYRLKYTTLDPENLAGDGIDALFKINVLGIDPFVRDPTDADGNGLSDAFERYHFGGVGIASPGGVGSADGLTHAEKDDLGLDPDVDYSAGAGSQTTGYVYDPVGRLTGATAPAAAADYGTDEEGNLLNSQ